MANTTELKKMKVSEFVEMYMKISPKLQGANSREKYLQKIRTVDYIPFRDKLALVTRIVNATTQDLDGVFSQSSPIRYVLLIMEVIKAYTSLDITEGTEIYDDYDLLNENGLIETLLAAIPDKEYGEFKVLMDMVVSDTMANKYEPHVFFMELVKTAASGTEKLLNLLESAAPTKQVE